MTSISLPDIVYIRFNENPGVKNKYIVECRLNRRSHTTLEGVYTFSTSVIGRYPDYTKAADAAFRAAHRRKKCFYCVMSDDGQLRLAALWNPKCAAKVVIKDAGEKKGGAKHARRTKSKQR